MVEVANPAGRLITFRVRSPVEDANAARSAAELRSAVVGAPGRVVICTDLTDARIFAAEAAERFVQAMKADNPKLERSAILLHSESPTFLLQLERMVREANHPDRRTFRDRNELSQWLEPSLSDEEKAALRTFLAAART